MSTEFEEKAPQTSAYRALGQGIKTLHDRQDAEVEYVDDELVLATCCPPADDVPAFLPSQVWARTRLSVGRGHPTPKAMTDVMRETVLK